MTCSDMAALLTAIVVACAFASARVSQIGSTIPAFNHIACQVRFCCKGQVTRLESCYEVAGFAAAGRIEGELPVEGEQLGNDIEMAVGLLTRQ
jgi:hypothetical protein